MRSHVVSLLPPPEQEKRHLPVLILAMSLWREGKEKKKTTTDGAPCRKWGKAKCAKYRHPV